MGLSNRFGQNLFVKFIATNGYGNNIFVDDIAMLEVDCNGGTQVSELQFKNTVSIYPNPSNGMAYLEVPEMFGDQLQIQVVNQLGQVMDHFTSGHLTRLTLNTTHLPEGIYHVRVVGKTATETVQMVVKY